MEPLLNQTALATPVPKHDRKKTVWIIVITALVSVLLSALVFYLILFHGNEKLGKLLAIEKLVDQNFYGDYNADSLENAMFSAYIGALGDRYAAYRSPVETEASYDQMMGQSAGIGVTVTKSPDRESILILHVYDGGPAKAAGLLEGDEIVAVDAKQVEEIGYDEAINLLQGDIGSTVSVVVSRGGTQQSFSITRADYEVQSVFYHVVSDYGYLEITDFNEATVNQFKTAIDNLLSQNVKGLIFDLRRNGGGTVDSVSEMLDYILPEGDIISVEYADGHRQTLYRSDEKEVDLPMTVLTDGDTASASELFSASIRDYQKGALIGETTFGKGVMQRTYTLPDGSSVKFTVAAFFPKSGVNFDGVGLAPDVEVKLTDEQKARFYLLTDEEDPVLQAAVEWLDTHAAQ